VADTLQWLSWRARQRVRCRPHASTQTIVSWIAGAGNEARVPAGETLVPPRRVAFEASASHQSEARHSRCRSRTTNVFPTGTNASLLAAAALTYKGKRVSTETERFGYAIEESTRVSLIVAAGLLPVADASASAQGVNDAQIASIVVTARQVDIDTGKLAHATPTNADVKKCAQLMITDHTSLL